MMTFVRNEHSSNDNFIHIYAGISKDALDEAINSLLSSSGYKMSQGVLGNATYVKGSRALRLLFGALCKYFKFTVISNVMPNNEVRVQVNRATSGMSGGLIGMNQVKNELKKLMQLFQTL